MPNRRRYRFQQRFRCDWASWRAVARYCISWDRFWPEIDGWLPSCGISSESWNRCRRRCRWKPFKRSLLRELGPLEHLGITLLPPAIAEASVAVVIPFKEAGDHLPHGGVFKILKPGIEERLKLELDLPARAGRGDRELGGRQGNLGDHRRDLRAPRLRRCTSCVDARCRAGHRGSLHCRQWGGEDLRDDGLAGRLDDRPEGRHQGRQQPAVPPDLERLQRRPAGGAGSGEQDHWMRCTEWAPRSTGGGRKSWTCWMRSQESTARRRAARSTSIRPSPD